MTRGPPAWRFGPLARLALLCAALGGCGEQDIRAIEALPLPASPDRGRVQVRDGNLLSDKGTRLRGVTYGVDANPAFAFDAALFDQLSGEAGLNAFHVYLENSAIEPGAYVAQADNLVELTSQAGMYLVLGIGAGDSGGSFDLDRMRGFWSFYAPRYAARTHVLFEILNIPDPGCDVAYSAEALAMEREVYDLIRAAAPSTHVAMFSFWHEPTAAALDANLDALEGSVDWSKASIAFHTQDCAGQDNVAALLAAARGRGVAAFASELSFGTPPEVTGMLEDERVGWMNFEWLVRWQDMAAFREVHDAAAVSWCPDFGTWPEDSQSCSTP